MLHEVCRSAKFPATRATGVKAGTQSDASVCQESATPSLEDWVGERQEENLTTSATVVVVLVYTRERFGENDWDLSIWV